MDDPFLLLAEREGLTRAIRGPRPLGSLRLSQIDPINLVEPSIRYKRIHTFQVCSFTVLHGAKLDAQSAPVG
jgi:hypothetical protein